MTRPRAVRVCGWVSISFAVLAAQTFAPLARAADATTTQCIAAIDTGVKLRGQGKLLDARNTLVTCTNPKCPATVRAECEKDVDEVNRALPTVVFAPKDASGKDVLTPVTVSMDGKPLGGQLDGRAIAVDPGPHDFTFETSGVPPAKKSLMIHEGEKDRRETVAFAAAGSATAPTPANTSSAAPGSTSPATPTADRTSTPPPSSTSSGAVTHTASGIELAVSTGYMIPLGSADGTSGDTMSNFLSGAVPLRVDAGWRFRRPSIFVGGYLAYAFASVASGSGSIGNVIGCGSNGITCSGNVLEYGIEAHAHFLPEGRFDPWVGVAFGWENATVNASGPGGSASAQLTGLDFVTFMLGGDFKPLSNLGIGPWLGLTLGQYGNISANGPTTNTSQSIDPTALHEWITLGVRGVYDINVGH